MIGGPRTIGFQPPDAPEESLAFIRDVMEEYAHMNFPDLSGAEWATSSYSSGNGGACVEVARNLAGVVPVRDSKDPAGPALVFGAYAWRDFLDGVRNGDFGRG